MIRLVIGYKASASEVVYCGDSGVDCQAAIDSNWEKFDRLETGELPVLRRARRSQALITPPSSNTTDTTPESPQAADATASRGKKKSSVPPAPEQPAAGAGGDEGPALV